MKIFSKPVPGRPSKALLLLVLGAMALICPPLTLAGTPYLPDLVQSGNRWTITFFDDTSAVHLQWATQGICFYNAGVVGTHQKYIWVSDTYPDWNGRASQEGDQIFMHGDFQWPFGTANGGHDGMTWELTTLKEGSGHWHEWVEDNAYGNTIGFGNTKLTRVGTCNQTGFATSDVALKSGQQLDIPRSADGRALPNPMGIFPDAVGK